VLICSPFGDAPASDASLQLAQLAPAAYDDPAPNFYSDVVSHGMPTFASLIATL
jgi:hypothetical protein